MPINDQIKKMVIEFDTNTDTLRSIIEYGKDIITLIEADGKVRYRSPSYFSQLGYIQGQMAEELVFESVHPDDAAVLKGLFIQLMKAPGSTFSSQWRQKHKDGSYRWMEGSGTNLLGDPEVKAIVCNFRDVTEHIRTKEELQKTNGELNLLINSIDEVAYTAMIDPYRITYMSTACFKMYGYHAQDFMTNEYLWVETIVPEDRHVAEGISIELQAGRTASHQVRIRHRDGTLKWIEINVSPTCDENGKLLRFDGLSRDITDKKNAELAILISEKKFRTLIENSKDGIALSNADRKFLYISPAIKDITGCEPEELIGKNTFDLFHPEEEIENNNFLSKLINKTDPFAPMVLRVRHKDGSWRWVELIASNKLEDPAINAIVTNFRDITEKKNAEDALLNSEKKFRSLIENSKECIGLTDSTGKIIYVTPSITAITGFTPEELIGQEYEGMVHPDELNSNQEHMAAMIGTDQTHITELVRTQHKDGSYRWIEATITNHLADPAVNAIVSNMRDVTDRKNAEEALMRSEKRYRALIENNKDAIALSGPDREIFYISPAIFDMLGYTPDEMTGIDPFSLMHPDEVADTITQREKISESGVTSKVLRLRHKNGCWRWVEVTGSNQLENPSVNAMVTNLRDVTDKKDAEEALLNSEKKFRALIENNHDGIGLTDRSQRFIYLSPSVKNILGYEPEELVGTGAFERYHPDDLPSMIELAMSIRNVSNGSGSNQVRIRHKDASWRWIELTATNKLEDPAINAIVTNFRDVTERKKADEALQFSEQRFKTLIEKNQDVIALSASDGSIAYISPSIKELLNYDPKELLGTSAMALMHPEELDANIKHLTWVNDNPGQSMFMILRMQHKDGSWRWVEATSTSQLDNPAVNAIVSNLRDVTERKMAQDELLLLNQSLEKKVEERTMQLAESNKALESFSSLAAHDLQAPLRILSGYAAMIKSEYADNLGTDGAALIDVIVKQTKQMTQLVSDLLSFSRVSHSIMREEQVNLDEMVGTLSDQLCLINSGTSTPEVKILGLGCSSCDANLMRQVWYNLISNALKYSGKKEKPEIEIGKTKANGETIYYVKDNGAGFDMRHSGKLFQVFQRLHSMNDFDGTGIGLALVKNVITRHGGRVWAESEVDKGATFFFSMPD